MTAFLGNHYTCNSFTRRLKGYFLLVQKGMIFAILSDYVIILGSILWYLQLKNSLYAIHIPGSFWNLMLGALVLYFAKSVWSRMTCFFTQWEFQGRSRSRTVRDFNLSLDWGVSNRRDFYGHRQKCKWLVGCRKFERDIKDLMSC